MVACGGSDSSPESEVRQVRADAIVTGVQRELDEAGVVVLDDDPQEEAPIPLDEAAAPFREYDVVPVEGALLRVDILPELNEFVPDAYQEMLVWAIRVDTSQSTEELLPRDADIVVGLVNAENGALRTIVSR
jgi:hypothetical protein